MIKKMRPSTRFVTILLVAAMFTALACSASDLGNPASRVSDSASATVDPTLTDGAALPKEVTEGVPAEAAAEAKPADAKPEEVRELR